MLFLHICSFLYMIFMLSNFLFCSPKYKITFIHFREQSQKTAVKQLHHKLTPSPLREQLALSSCARALRKRICTPRWLGHYLSAALQAISQHRISGAIQRHRITDAGMRLDRAGGGAASGEEERLPRMILLIPASGRE